MAREMVIGGDTFVVGLTSNVVARRVLVMDSANRGQAKLPAITTPEKTFVAVASEAADRDGYVKGQTHGIAPVESDGTAVVNPGDYVIAGALGDGRIKTQALAAGSANIYNVIGICVNRAQVPAVLGAIVEVELYPFVICAA